MDSSSNPILEPSKTDMKKQIIELFQESFRDDAIDGSQNLQERSKVHPTICDSLLPFVTRDKKGE